MVKSEGSKENMAKDVNVITNKEKNTKKKQQKRLTKHKNEQKQKEGQRAGHLHMCPQTKG